MAVCSVAQCNGQTIPEPGLVCTEAPVLCQVECLDGFTGTLPDVLVEPQPESLCNGGMPNNVSWFAFVAGSDSISLTITPSNCTVVQSINDSTGVITLSEGIQVGIYRSCDFDDSDREVACAIDCSTDPVEIGASTFVVGETYYLFVDGCDGSVCDYSVAVNFGMQAFEMPEIVSFSNQYNFDFANDTICAGSSVFVSIDDFEVDAEFEWTIQPPTSDYPAGVHPVTDSSAVTWQFSEPGQYDVCVFAFNFCDANDTTCFTVQVDTLVDEYFSPIEVCQECYPIILSQSDTSCVIGDLGLIAPTVLTEDPNGDGTIGWQGVTPIMQAGSVVNVVPAEYGCDYTQYIDISTIPISPREPVTLYRCPTDFPFTYHGVNITGPVTNQFITIEGAAASRCDSLVSLTVETVGQSSTITTGDCIAGGVALIFNLNADLPPQAVVSYEWLLGGSPVTDADGIDTVLQATMSGAYSINVTITIDGADCSFTRGGPIVDLNNLVPSLPNFAILPDSICADGAPVSLYVDAVAGSTYTWSLLPSLPFTVGQTSDTIYVDVSGNTGFQYCVSAANACGVSPDTCQIMSVATAPTGSVVATDTVCIDSLATVSYMGDASPSTATFVWGFDIGTVVSTNDIEGPGPHEVSFSAPGTYQISTIISQGLCTSGPLQSSIVVRQPLQAPTVDCGSLPSSVVFLVPTLPPGVTYDFVVSAGTYIDAYASADSIVVTEVPAGTDIVIEVTFADECSEVVETYICTALDCPAVDLQIVLDYVDGSCAADVVEVLATVTNSGMATDMGAWQGANIPVNGSIELSAAGVYPLNYILTVDGCDFVVEDSIVISPTPTLSNTIVTGTCMDTTVTVELSTDVPGTLYWQEIELLDADVSDVSEGSYTATVSTAVGCTDTVVIDVILPPMPTLQIEGSLQVVEGSTAEYILLTQNVNIDSVIWLLNGIEQCVDASCASLSLEPIDGDVLCVQYIDAAGCFVEDCITIMTYQEARVFMPNIFSPNGDQTNDFFFPVSNQSDLPVLYMYIYDRWGNEVFAIENSAMGEQGFFWDGSHKGRQLNEGVYIYRLAYMAEGEVIVLTGDVTLAR